MNEIGDTVYALGSRFSTDFKLRKLKIVAKGVPSALVLKNTDDSSSSPMIFVRFDNNSRSYREVGVTFSTFVGYPDVESANRALIDQQELYIKEDENLLIRRREALEKFKKKNNL